MYFIAAFGLLMLLLSLVMAVKPESFSKGIISFSEQPYFHIAEVISRIIAGLIFTHYSTDTQFPQTIFAIGIVLLGVGMGLALTHPTIQKIRNANPIGATTLLVVDCCVVDYLKSEYGQSSHCPEY